MTGKLSVAGWTVGDRVTINSKNRNSHGWKGVVDGFDQEVPGIVRVRVMFDRRGAQLVMTFDPGELVTR